MKQNPSLEFMIIDDDNINNEICTKVINLSYPGAAALSFTRAADGYEYLTKQYVNAATKHLVLFLDINLPEMTGWDFLELLMEIPKEHLRNVIIYILSSSLCEEDQERAASYTIVTGFINKPLTRNLLKSLLGGSE